ncbi:unnamed protein product [Rotaria socialis]|uniref:Uncharacterized protein n=1 Tax=Rotaria socialis TaxID=392032 RepID=A0A820LY83_9BILA|nr:unnamed protein product [Rotaria socialis]CAF3438016.1 unnamed protein product [Rotaria socialis]CAF4343170.1 unnamed protein product [Rotaria socialis]CAF4364102.1 unnamed protein product [Rotaria socialis]
MHRKRIVDGIREQSMGQFKEDKMNGKGTFFYDDENTYAEDWADGLKEGEGVFTWKNGDRHEMEYSQNMFLLTDSPKGIWSNDTLI